MINEIAFTAYPANDVAAARAWYEATLGLVFAGPFLENGIEKYNEAHLGNGCFSLMVPEWAGRAAGSGTGVVFEVDDLDATMLALRANDVAHSNVFDGPVCRQVSLVDLDGNAIGLHQRKVRVVTPPR